MKCPQCQGALTPERVGAVEIGRCASCDGHWFDVGDLERALEGARDEIRRRFAVPEGTARVPAPPGECPSCGEGAKLIRVKSVVNRTVAMDGCPVCHGRWLPAGELGRLAGGRGVFARLRAMFL